VIARLSNLRLAPGHDLEHHPDLLPRGLKTLRIEFGPA
jgi:hypothetical protein